MDYQEYKKEQSHIKEFLLRIPGAIDFIQLFSAVLLLGIGVLFIYGIGQQIGSPAYLSMWKKQLVWISLGSFFWIFFAFFFDYRNLKKWSLVIYPISIFLLLAVFIWGVKINEARRWFSIAGGMIKIQPSEFAKITLVIVNAMILSSSEFSISKFMNLFAVILLNIIPFILIALEPDLGAAIIILPIVASMIFIAGIKWRWIILFVIVLLVAIPSAYPFLKEYQKERIKVFLDPARDPANRGWNALQSELAVGSGGVFGKGFMQGNQHTLGFLPRTVSSTDFIFSVIAEETGFVGSIFVISLYFLLLISIFRTAILSTDKFGRYIAIGVSAIIFLHSFVNIAMTMRLLPVKGLPLPLISYGGSFTVSILVCLGILQSVYRISVRENVG